MSHVLVWISLNLCLLNFVSFTKIRLQASQNILKVFFPLFIYIYSFSFLWSTFYANKALKIMNLQIIYNFSFYTLLAVAALGYLWYARCMFFKQTSRLSRGASKEHFCKNGWKQRWTINTRWVSQRMLTRRRAF